jgi:hypothetical protein
MKKRTSEMHRAFAEGIGATTHFAMPDGLRGTRVDAPFGAGDSEPATVPARSSQ